MIQISALRRRPHDQHERDIVRSASASGLLADKVIIVTGAARGLGAAIAELLAVQGANVVVADFNAEGAQASASKLRERGWRATPCELDVGSEQSVAQAVQEIAHRYGRIDALINNAGVDVTQSLSELSVADWERVIRTNLHGPFLTAKLALPSLIASRGQIINIVSTAAKRAWPNASAYHASKYGLLGLSHALHAELRSQGVKVTAVIAGGMKTPFLLDRFPDLDPDLLQDPQNVARTVLFALTMPDESVIPELTVLPMRETSWP